MKRRLLPFALSLVVALGSLASYALGGPSDEKKVTLLYTTDIHGHFLPFVSVPTSKDADKAPKEKRTGGLAAIDAKVREIKASAGNPVFVFDSGDVMTGHPVCDLVQDGVVGAPLFKMMNAVGYDAWCIGNHDFDHGRANTAKLLELARFPTFSANLKIEGDPQLKVQRWQILEKGGVKVGVFGLMTEHLLEVVGREKVAGISVGSCAQAAREAVAALHSRCDVIVALSHCGSDEDVKLADQVSGIDVILSGHNHQPLKAALHGKTIIAEGTLRAAKLGRLDLTLKDGQVIAHKGQVLTIEHRPAEGELKTVLDEVDATLGKRLGEVLAKLEVAWKRDYHAESNIGDFFADAMRDHAKTDVAFLNAGGIRENLAAGNVTIGDVAEIFPFDNEIVTFELTGADLLQALEKNASAAAAREYGILQVSGVRYEWERHGKSGKVLKAEVGGAPLDPKRSYRCAAIDFIAVDQHAKYLGEGVVVSKLERLAVLMTSVAQDFVRSQGQKGPIRFESDGRMREKHGQP
ncbi:bifunctional metallophosphatase/5'-nucleotidase [bacterium]|nr:bifunctional metallophosphatase/5'-nucleotidase [bacterium]